MSKDKNTAMVSFNTLVGAVNNEEYILKIYGLDDKKTIALEISRLAVKLADLRG